MTYIIAEIGINHNGDIALAKELMKEHQSTNFNIISNNNVFTNINYDNVSVL